MKRTSFAFAVILAILTASSAAQADTTYTVRPGDKLRTSILDARGISLGELLDANPGKIGRVCGRTETRISKTGVSYTLCRRLRHYIVAGTVLTIPEPRATLAARADNLARELANAQAEVSRLQGDLIRESHRRPAAQAAPPAAQREQRAKAHPAVGRGRRTVGGEIPALPTAAIVIVLLAAALWAASGLRRKNRLIAGLRGEADNAARQARDVREELDGRQRLLADQTEEQKRGISLLKLAAEDRLKDLDAKLAEAEAAKQAAERERTDLKAHQAELTGRDKKLDEDMRLFKAGLAELASKAQAERDALQLEKMRLQTELQDTQTERDRLQRELSAMPDRLRAELRSEVETRLLGDLERTRTAMREAIRKEVLPEAAAQAQTVHQERIEGLDADLRLEQEKTRRLEEELAQARTEAEAKAGVLEEKVRQVVDGVQTLKARYETERATLHQELTDLRPRAQAEAAAASEIKLRLLQSEIRTLDTKCRELEGQLTSYRDELARSRVEAEEWGERLAQALEAAKSLKAQHEVELDVQRQELAELRPKYQAEFAAAEELRAGLLRGEIQSLDARCLELERQLTASRHELALTQTESKDAAKRRGEMVAEKLEAIQTLRAQHEVELAAVREQVRSEVESDVGELYRDRNDMLRADRDALRQEQSALEAEKQRLTEKVEEADRLRRELESREAIVSQREEELRDRMTAIAQSQERLDKAWEEHFQARIPSPQAREPRITPPLPTPAPAAEDARFRTPPLPLHLAETLEDLTEHAQEEPVAAESPEASGFVLGEPTDLPRETTAIVRNPLPAEAEATKGFPEAPPKTGRHSTQDNVDVDLGLFFQPLPKSDGNGFICIVPGCEAIVSRDERQAHLELHDEGPTVAKPSGGNGSDQEDKIRHYQPTPEVTEVDGIETYRCHCGPMRYNLACWEEHVRRGHLECFICSPPVVIQSDNLARHMNRAHPERVGKPAKARRKATLLR